MLYALIALLELSSTLLATHKYTVHIVLLKDFLTLVFPNKLAQVHIVPGNFPCVIAFCPILEIQ